MPVEHAVAAQLRPPGHRRSRCALLRWKVVFFRDQHLEGGVVIPPFGGDTQWTSRHRF